MIYLALLFISFLGAETLSPKLGYFVQEIYMQQLDSPFAPLTEEERKTQWGKEYHIGLSFGKQLDLYQAITAFKRASILIPKDHFQRCREMDYHIIKAYYLGGQPQLATEFFEQSLLATIEPTFSAFHDLLVILYDAYTSQKEGEKSETILKVMEKTFPFEKEKLALTSSILSGDIDGLKSTLKNPSIDSLIASVETSLDSQFFEETERGLISKEISYEKEEQKLKELYALKECKKASDELYKEYLHHRKNPTLASGLNAILPGLGYLYLGQKQSALTALFINGLTTAAAVYFYKNDNLPAALLTLSFESGWYFGGIVGAKHEAEFFNTRVFEGAAHYRMRDHKLYPILMLRYGF
jgi:hypothetical protein